uniref:glucuronosyltransferase n=1 Tax=Steinernema glaseri TaxID=37863 RepID=A0A1I7YGJ0_9BILA
MQRLFLALLLLACAAQSAKVLIMPSSIYPVHRYTMKTLAEELVKRKHEVTWFEHGWKKPEIALPKEVEEIFVTIPTSSAVIRDLYVARNHSVHDRIWNADFEDESERTSAWFASIELCDGLLSSGEGKKQFDSLVERQFDTVVVDDLYNPCGLLHTGLQKSVFIYWSMTSLRTESAWAHHSPSPPSYLPVHGTKLTDRLSFTQRGYNLAAYLRAIYVHQSVVLPRMDQIFQKFYPELGTTAFYMERNASINYVNTPPIFDFARPYMPRVNFVGGLHCHKPKPLTGELKTFVESANAEKGFMVFSTGFTAQWKRAPKTLVNAIVTAMRRNLEIKFVWQYDAEPIPNLPSNVITSKWLPLQNLLGHPKCKAHISHGGLNSVVESVWHGVPVIGFPLTVSGFDNILRVTDRNAGIMIPKNKWNADSFEKSFEDIYKKQYKEEMLVFQDMVIDVPYTELNHSAFWVEFIQRHQEVPHARSGADKLNVLQYFLVDVVLFLLSVLVLIVATVVYVLKLATRMVFGLFRLVLGKGDATKSAAAPAKGGSTKSKKAKKVD